MFSDKIKQSQKHSINSDFAANGKVVSVLNFLEKYLPIFPEKHIICKEDDEWNLNEALFGFLDIYSRNFAFQFIPEYRYKHKSRPDLGIKEVKSNKLGFFYDQQAVHFFDIECKRLYDNNKSKQYVSGKTGGIQRFKENRHGVDLPQSAMIGYVEIENFSFWHNKVNSWISDKEEHLQMLDNKNTAKLKSTHQRQNSEKTSIELTHFWLKMEFIDN